MASGTSEPGPLRFGPFVAGRRIAVGGMAEVFEARRGGETGPARFVVKLLLPQYARDPDLVAALRHEAALARVLSHPNLVAVVDVGVEGDQTWLAMERVDGPTLAELTRATHEHGERGRALPTELAVHVVRDLVRALSCVHDARGPAGEPLHIVHRDVTPQNVLVSRAGEVRLGDFGIARSGLRDGRTRTGVIKGKLAYLAPEQATGSAIDARTDLYAAGVILWELLARAPYLVGETEMELLRAAEAPPFRPAGTGDPELEALLERMLRRFPEERPARAVAVLERLDAWLTREGATDRTAALAALVVELFGPGELAAERPPPPRARARSPMALVLAVGAMAVGGGAWMLARDRGTDGSAPPVRRAVATVLDAGARLSPSRPRATGNPPSTDAGPPATSPPPDAGGEPAQTGAPRSARRQSTRPPMARIPDAGPPAATIGTVTPPSPSTVPDAGPPQIDAEFVRRKLERVDVALRAARREGRDTSALDELAAAALQSHLDGHLEETNRRLDQILARLRAPR